MKQQFLPSIKTQEEIQEYLKNGIRFGKVLKQLYDQVSINYANNSGSGYVNLFEDLVYKEFSNEDEIFHFPFLEIQNQIGNKFNNIICVSKNEYVGHCKPNYEKFIETDIVKIDCGIQINNLCYDAAFTKTMNSSLYDKKWVLKPLTALKQVTKFKFSNTKQISNIIEKELHPCKIVTQICGHGIGRFLHEPPDIYNMDGGYLPTELVDGMVLCLEPVCSDKSHKSIFTEEYWDGKISYELREEPIQQVVLDSDYWGIRTNDNSLATHWETMFLVKDGRLIDLLKVTEWDI